MKKKLQNLVKLSYADGRLNQEAVETIASKLTRLDLKQYIKLLKQEESKKEVLVVSPVELNEIDQKKIEKLFDQKKAVYIIDQSMISGIKIIENDVEYEINLNRTFDHLVSYLSKND